MTESLARRGAGQYRGEIMTELIQPELTPKERGKLYAAGEEVDRIPVTASLGETIPVLYGYSMDKYYHETEVMVEVETRMANDYHLDNMGVGLGLRALPEALGVTVHYVDNDLSYNETPAMTSYDELEGRPLVDIHKDGRIPAIVESFKILKERFGETNNLSTGISGPITTACALFGTSKLLKDMVKDPEGVHKAMRYSLDNYLSCAKQLHDELGIGISLAEPLASRELLSLKQFEEFELPYLQELCTKMKEMQGAMTLHICGRTHDRWHHLHECGFNGFWMDNCESMAEFKDLYGEDMGVTGNIPPVNVVRDGSPEEIEEAVKQCVVAAGDNPRGFTLSPGCTVPVLTSAENLTTIMNSAMKYGGHARKGQYPEGIKEYL